MNDSNYLKNKKGLFCGSTLITSGHVTFFDKIDTASKAYFLGFFAADAAIDKNGKSVSIVTADRDSQILHDFLDCSQWKTEVKIKKHKYPQKVIRLASTHLVTTLASWGLTNNKSLTLKLIKDIPSQYASDFVRGVWDGDGWVGERQYSLCSGSEAFVVQIRNLILNHTNQALTITKPSNRNHFVLAGSKGQTSALRWIYSNPYPVLQRKAIQVSRFWL